VKKTVLLTGAAGFIGSNFLRYLFDKYPDYHFLVLDCLTYAGNPENIAPDIKSSSRFEFWYGNVNNRDLVDSLMERSQLVVHFAAESHVARSIFDNSRFFETDVLGTQVLMNSLLKYKQVERFIHISTSEVYGTAETMPMSEEHPLNCRSPYAGAKAGADRLVYSYWCTYDLPVLIIRPFNNYGPFQHLEKMIPRFITSALTGTPLTIHGDGGAQRDWIFVLDHCEALDRALHIDNFATIKNKIINIGTGVSTSNLAIAEFILDQLGVKHSLLRFIGDRPGQVVCHNSSTDKAEQLLSWKPKVDIWTGLKSTIQWYQGHELWWKNIEWMKAVPIYTAQKKWELH
jgi:dTDP-glucose 4,6-dehydratase